MFKKINCFFITFCNKIITIDKTIISSISELLFDFSCSCGVIRTKIHSSIFFLNFRLAQPCCTAELIDVICITNSLTIISGMIKIRKRLHFAIPLLTTVHPYQLFTIQKFPRLTVTKSIITVVTTVKRNVLPK